MGDRSDTLIIAENRGFVKGKRGRISEAGGGTTGAETALAFPEKIW